MKRATDLAYFYKRPEILIKLGPGKMPQFNFSLHMGWVIQGAIGSDLKMDACYLSPHLLVALKVEKLCEFYESEILVTEAVYNIMSLKARNTLRKIDVISMKEWKEEKLGLFAFDLSFTN